MMSEHRSRLNGLHGSSIDRIGRDVVPLRSGAYGLNDISAYGVTAEPAYGVTAEPSRAGLTGGMSTRGYLSPLDDPVLRQRRDFHVGLSPVPPGNLDGIFERHDSERIVNGISLPSRETNMLFVDGLPTDCTRREVGHIFRPFIGFKDIKVIHKEPRRSGDKAMVLCFVEFNDSKCALTAMDALQGYKFDDKKPDSPILRIQFAHFPFRLPSELDDQRLGSR